MRCRSPYSSSAAAMCRRSSKPGNAPSGRSPITASASRGSMECRPSGRRRYGVFSMPQPVVRAGSPSSARGPRAIYPPALLSSQPALLGNIEDHAVGVLVLDLEVRFFLRFAEGEEELAAGRLDALLRRLDVIDLEAEVMCADEIGRVLDSRARLALVLEQREVDHAVGKIDARAHLEVLLADALELEHLLVESRGFLEVFDDDRYVPQFRHGG